MADVTTTYTRLLMEATNRENYFVRQHIDPLHAAIGAARKNYDDTMKAQKKVDDLKAEVAVTLLFVAGSVAIAAAAPAAGALFSATAVSASKRLGGNAAKLLSVAKTASDVLRKRTLAKYAWEKLSSESLGLIKSQAIEQAKALNSGLGDTTITSGNLDVIRTAAKAQLSKTFMHIRAVIKAIEAAPISDEAKLKFASEVLKTPFFATTVKDMNYQNAIRHYELILYMHYVLDRDYIETRHVTVGPSGAHSFTTKGARISEMPKSSSYPKSAKTGGLYSTTMTSPGYEDVGNVIAGRINLLYTQIFLNRSSPVHEWIDDDFRLFSKNTDKAQLIKAQNLLERLIKIDTYKKKIPV